jgi:signal transduction histidine kinase
MSGDVNSNLQQGDRVVASAAICRAVLLGRAAVVMTAAGAGLLLVQHPWRVVAVLGLVVLVAAFQITILTRRPAVVQHPWLNLGGDLLCAVAVLALSEGGMPFFCYIGGSAALAGAVLGMRAAPVWVGQAILGFAAAAAVLRSESLPPNVEAFVLAFPMVSVLAGMGGAAATSSLMRYVDLSVGVVAAAQRSAAASERARLARELHDSVAKTLRAVSFAALALPSSLRRHPALAEQLAGIVSEGAVAAAREAQRLVDGLRVDALDRDFSASIYRICRSWAENSRVKITVVVDRVEPSVAVRYELVRILQEALRNVERHACARHVRVDMRLAGDGAAELRISDDGVGFVPRELGELQSHGHYGIVGMSERIVTAGGVLDVASSPGSGTVVTVRVPIDQQHADRRG